MKIEFLMQVDHEVAFRPDALSDLLQRFDHLWNARACVVQASAAPAATSARTGARAAGSRTRSAWTGSSAGVGQDAAVHAVHAPASCHRRCCTLLETHLLRLFGRHDPLREAA